MIEVESPADPRSLLAMKLPNVALSLLFAFTLLLPASARITLPDCFSHNMVLQRGMPIPVWGTAAPEQDITITFLGQETTATTDKDGNWSMKLPAAEAGGPHVFKIADGQTFENVLVGDVWLGSGQSNMAGSAGGYARRDEVLKAQLDTLAETPNDHLRLLSSKGGWVLADGKNSPKFSALLLSFGIELQKAIDVPVGLRVGAVGGTPSGRWLTPEMFEGNEAAAATLAANSDDSKWEAIQAAHAKKVAAWEKAAAKAKDADKKPPRRPRAPLEPGVLPAHTGNLYRPHIEPFQGYGIRGVLWDQGESGTALPGIDQYTAMGALITGWRGAWGQDFPFLYVQKPSGGGPAFDPENPVTRKAEAFAARAANRVAAFETYRLQHTEIAKHPNTAMVQSVDLGGGVHPVNKSGYGARAAQVALGFAYDQDVSWSGPRFKAHEIKDGAVHLTFDHATAGLVFKGGDVPGGFTIAGEDKVFRIAEATLDGSTVVLRHPDVETPVAARYGCEKKRADANVFNSAGLPMVAFRTDWSLDGIE